MRWRSSPLTAEPLDQLLLTLERAPRPPHGERARASQACLLYGPFSGQAATRKVTGSTAYQRSHDFNGEWLRSIPVAFSDAAESQ